jgi:hypothetical protein
LGDENIVGARQGEIGDMSVGNVESARTVKSSGVRLRCEVCRQVERLNATRRDHRVSSSILGHQLAMVARSTSFRSGGMNESSAKRWRWARRASEVRVAREEKII